jgi:hypothetical protein
MSPSSDTQVDWQLCDLINAWHDWDDSQPERNLEWKAAIGEEYVITMV